MQMVNLLQVQYMGIPAGSPSTNAVAGVYGGIAFSIDSTGDTYLDMYGIGSGSYGHIALTLRIMGMIMYRITLKILDIRILMCGFIHIPTG